MPEHKVITANQVTSDKLYRFLAEVFPPIKTDFLQEHASWLHRTPDNRWVVVINDEIAAHASYIMTTCMANGNLYPVRWLVDMMVHPRFRGMGLWSVINKELQSTNELKLGFPNEIAARIHAKNGWGVHNNIRYMIMPLRPAHLKRVQTADGLKGMLLKAGAIGLSPLAALYRMRVSRSHPRKAFPITRPEVASLTRVFEKHMSTSRIATTYRNEEYLQWRYIDSPYQSEFRFYGAGEETDPALIAITRSLTTSRGKIVRILDVFGNMDRSDLLRDLLTMIIRDSVQDSALEIHAIASLPPLIRSLQTIGFILSKKTLFCWHSKNIDTMNKLANTSGHWVFSDSDNDDPVD